MGRDKGVTLVELLVSLSLAVFVLTLAFFIFQRQFRYSLIQRSKSVLQVESYTGVNLIVYDIIHAGFGLRRDVRPIFSKNSNPDTLFLVGNAVRTDRTPAWSVLVSKATLSTSLIVRKWIKGNIKAGDWIVILTDTKGFLGGPFSVVEVTEVDGPDLDGDGSPDPCLNLRLSAGNPVTAGKASLIFTTSPDHTQDTVRYFISSGVLYRNGSPVIDSVEDFEVSFLLDTDNNGIYDTWTTDINSLNAEQIENQLGVVRFSILVKSGQRDPSYRFPKKTVKIEEHEYEIEDPHYRRIIITKRVIPRNVR